jgi:hypothetical protein
LEVIADDLGKNDLISWWMDADILGELCEGTEIAGQFIEQIEKKQKSRSLPF